MNYPDTDWCPCRRPHTRDDHANAMAARDMMLELRPEVAAFAQAMEAQLRANDHKPGWKDDSPADLMRRLVEETVELRHALLCLESYATGPCSPGLSSRYVGRVLKEAADVANFAMMVADVCGGLET